MAPRGEANAAMVRLRRAQMINLVEHSYYSNIDHRRLGTVLDCFARDAVLSVDGRRLPGRNGEIERFLVRFLEAHPLIRHGEFVHTVDEAGQRLACFFRLRLKDAHGETRAAAGEADFRMHNGKFREVSVAGDGGPTI